MRIKTNELIRCVVLGLAFAVSSAFSLSASTMLGYSNNDSKTGIVKFDSDNFSPQLIFSNSSKANAAGYGPEGYYVISNGKLYCYNVSTGTSQEIGDCDTKITDLAYDYKNSRMLAIAGKTLEEVNLTSGAVTKVCDLNVNTWYSLTTLAVNSNGDWFVMDSSGFLFSVDQSGNGAYAGSSGLMFPNSVYIDFDGSDQMYLIYNDYYGTHFTKIDSATGKTETDSYSSPTASGFDILGLCANYVAPTDPDASTATLPYECAFATEDEFNSWTAYDVDNNESTWHLGNALGNKNGAEDNDLEFNTANNWLVSPAITIPAGTTITVSYKAYTAYYEGTTIEITMGNGNTPTDQTISLDKRFIQNYSPGEDVTFDYVVTTEGNYNFGIHRTDLSAYKSSMAHINDFKIKVKDDGSVEGKVSCEGVAISGADITINDTKYTSDANGNYSVSSIKAGEYTVTAQKAGYHDFSGNFTVEVGKTTTYNIEMVKNPAYNVSSTITDVNNSPIGGAAIELAGDNNYKANSNKEGKFTIENVLVGNYTMTIRKNGYELYSSDITVDASYSVNTIALTQKVLSPFSITANESKSGIDVKWTAPKDTLERKYDDGTINSCMGYDEGTEMNVVGTIFRTPSVIHNVKWYSMGNSGKPEHVHILIIDLDKNGEPTGELIYSKKNVPCTVDSWNTFTLPTPVNAPNGFLVALSSEGNVNLAIDNGEEDGSIRYPRTQVYSTYYSDPMSYYYLDEMSQKSKRFLLRADCEYYEDKSLVNNIDLSYDLYRLPANEQDNEANWTKVLSETKDLSYADTELARGEYRYAVKAIYPVDNKVSAAKISDIATCNMLVDVTLNVTTNAEGTDADGAAVTLTNAEGSYKATVANNKAVINGVLKGKYNISIAKQGFETIQAADVDLDTDLSEKALDYTLTQRLDQVSNLDATFNEDNSWTLYWNAQPNLFDNFDGEDHPAFTIDSPGNIGWIYRDNDHFKTYGFGYYSFPNMNSPMAAIILSSEGITPTYEGSALSYSGDQSLTFFSAKETMDEEENIVINESDDYFISPKLSFVKDFTFKFMARSHDNENGLERMRVGYSMSGTLPTNFIWENNGEYINVPCEEFTEYSFDIPKDAKYVAINNHAINTFALHIDDVNIGTSTQVKGNDYVPVNVIKYKVYVDGEYLTETTNLNCAINNLDKEKHVASVVAVYATGESAPLEIELYNNNSAITNSVAANLSITQRGKSAVINGDYKTASVYSVSGIELMKANGTPIVDMSKLSDGVYIVKAISPAGKSVSAKILIK